MEQPAQQRYVLHVLYATPALRGGNAGEGPDAWPVEVIEETPPLANVGCKVRLPHAIASVRLVPEESELAFSQNGDAVEFTIPVVKSHQMIELNWRT